MKNWMAAVGLCLALATPVHAEVTAREVLRQYDASNMTNWAFVAGVLIGFQWSNGDLEHDGKQKLFCQPQDKTLEVEDVMTALRGFIRKYPPFADWQAGFALLQALKEAFPCRK